MNSVTQTETISNASMESTEIAKKSKVSGKTIGEPALSDKAAKYYESLKKKYGNMDFILVSKEMKSTAQAQASSYANPSRVVVLIDEEKIERMAEDENFRKQYEGIISAAQLQLPQLKESLAGSTGASAVKGYGMNVKDNGAVSFFAVMGKSMTAQRDRLAKKAAQKKADKKAEAKAEAKKDAEEARKEKAEEAGKTDTGAYDNNLSDDDSDTVTITASSIEELLQKIDDYMMSLKSDTVQTDQELQVGQHFDASL